ncbi:MAG: GDSL-type esterase/lipase family protein [Alphaproteobacteria bacterium]
MKSILCFGDSITWGYNPKNGTRYPPEDRWPRVFEAAAQGRARVIEEALNGRTTATDEPTRPCRNGLAMFPALLEAHAPLDVVIIMLGTNDSAPCYGLTAGRIAFNCVALIRLNAEMSLLYSGGQATSRGLAAAYDSIAKRFGISFIDAGKIIKVSAVDGVHLDREDQRKLGQAVADVVTPLL